MTCRPLAGLGDIRQQKRANTDTRGPSGCFVWKASGVRGRAIEGYRNCRSGSYSCPQGQEWLLHTRISQQSSLVVALCRLVFGCLSVAVIRITVAMPGGCRMACQLVTRTTPPTPRSHGPQHPAPVTWTTAPSPGHVQSCRAGDRTLVHDRCERTRCHERGYRLSVQMSMITTCRAALDSS